MKRRLVLKHNAFTIVELLVVIGIIAVLIAILLPALNAARKQAKLTACASNLRQIAAAAIEYAGDNHGFLPQRYLAGYAPIPTGGAISYWNSYYEGSFATASYAYNPCNIGQLLTSGYLGNLAPANFFPNNPSTGNPYYYDFSLAPIRFDPGVDAQTIASAVQMFTATGQSWAYYSDYAFNPHWAFTSANGNWGNGTAINDHGDEVSQYNRISQYSPYHALVADIIMDPAASPHLSNDQSSGKWNLAYSDGHVVTVNMSNPFNTNGATWPYNQSPPSSNNHCRYDDDLDLLECMAAGGNPLISMGDPSDKLFGYNAANKFLRRFSTSDISAVPGDGTYPNDNDHPWVPWK